MERKRRFQTRQQYAEEKAQNTKFDRVNKNLNVLIAIVAIAIVATLAIILSKDPVPNDQAEAKDANEQVSSDEQQSGEDQTGTGITDENDQDDENVTEETDNAEETTDVVENTVLPSADPIVQEVQVNDTWTAYPTEQTGTHESIFEKGHIDYEEKLKAIFSVLDLEQENSIVLRIKNNGSASTAIAVVTSMDKEQMYRVSIEWIDGEGWKPTRLEVLNTVEDAY
ncbi:YrrS family protein [Solibacillus sp. FSL R7-0668]|uniref:YrrS family protein n=1 Tax=Solibacillus sp. FSL R7-0668 TaxID=2921688 RepID=UPI0030FC684A